MSSDDSGMTCQESRKVDLFEQLLLKQKNSSSTVEAAAEQCNLSPSSSSSREDINTQTIDESPSPAGCSTATETSNARPPIAVVTPRRRHSSTLAAQLERSDVKRRRETWSVKGSKQSVIGISKPPPPGAVVLPTLLAPSEALADQCWGVGGAGGRKRKASATTSGKADLDEGVAQLIVMGYDEVTARKSLEFCGGDIGWTVDFLATLPEGAEIPHPRDTFAKDVDSLDVRRSSYASASSRYRSCLTRSIDDLKAAHGEGARGLGAPLRRFVEHIAAPLFKKHFHDRAPETEEARLLLQIHCKQAAELLAACLRRVYLPESLAMIAACLFHPHLAVFSESLARLEPSLPHQGDDELSSHVEFVDRARIRRKCACEAAKLASSPPHTAQDNETADLLHPYGPFVDRVEAFLVTDPFAAICERVEQAKNGDGKGIELRELLTVLRVLDTLLPLTKDDFFEDVVRPVITTVHEMAAAFPEKELRQADKRELMSACLALAESMMSSSSSTIGPPPAGGSASAPPFCQGRMDFFLRCMHAPQLKERIHGIHELGLIATEHRDDPLVQAWFRDNDILRLVLAGNLDHRDYLAKAEPLLIVMARQLSDDDFNYLFTLRKGRQGMSSEAFDALVLAFVKGFSVAQIQRLFTFYRKILERGEKDMLNRMLKVVQSVPIEHLSMEITTELASQLWAVILEVAAHSGYRSVQDQSQGRKVATEDQSQGRKIAPPYSTAELTMATQSHANLLCDWREVNDGGRGGGDVSGRQLEVDYAMGDIEAIMMMTEESDVLFPIRLLHLNMLVNKMFEGDVFASNVAARSRFKTFCQEMHKNGLVECVLQRFLHAIKRFQAAAAAAEAAEGAAGEGKVKSLTETSVAMPCLQYAPFQFSVWLNKFCKVEPRLDELWDTITSLDENCEETFKLKRSLVSVLCAWVMNFFDRNSDHGWDLLRRAYSLPPRAMTREAMFRIARVTEKALGLLKGEEKRNLCNSWLEQLSRILLDGEEKNAAAEFMCMSLLHDGSLKFDYAVRFALERINKALSEYTRVHGMLVEGVVTRKLTEIHFSDGNSPLSSPSTATVASNFEEKEECCTNGERLNGTPETTEEAGQMENGDHCEGDVEMAERHDKRPNGEAVINGEESNEKKETKKEEDVGDTEEVRVLQTAIYLMRRLVQYGYERCLVPSELRTRRCAFPGATVQVDVTVSPDTFRGKSSIGPFKHEFSLSTHSNENIGALRKRISSRMLVADAYLIDLEVRAMTEDMLGGMPEYEVLEWGKSAWMSLSEALPRCFENTRANGLYQKFELRLILKKKDPSIHKLALLLGAQHHMESEKSQLDTPLPSSVLKKTNIVDVCLELLSSVAHAEVRQQIKSLLDVLPVWNCELTEFANEDDLHAHLIGTRCLSSDSPLRMLYYMENIYMTLLPVVKNRQTMGEANELLQALCGSSSDFFPRLADKMEEGVGAAGEDGCILLTETERRSCLEVMALIMQLLITNNSTMHFIDYDTATMSSAKSEAQARRSAAGRLHHIDTKCFVKKMSDPTMAKLHSVFRSFIWNIIAPPPSPPIGATKTPTSSERIEAWIAQGSGLPVVSEEWAPLVESTIETAIRLCKHWGDVHDNMESALAELFGDSEQREDIDCVQRRFWTDILLHINLSSVRNDVLDALKRLIVPRRKDDQGAVQRSWQLCWRLLPLVRVAGAERGLWTAEGAAVAAKEGRHQVALLRVASAAARHAPTILGVDETCEWLKKELEIVVAPKEVEKSGVKLKLDPGVRAGHVSVAVSLYQHLAEYRANNEKEILKDLEAIHRQMEIVLNTLIERFLFPFHSNEGNAGQFGCNLVTLGCEIPPNPAGEECVEGDHRGAMQKLIEAFGTLSLDGRGKAFQMMRRLHDQVHSKLPRRIEDVTNGATLRRRHLPVGLRNELNTCYLNTVLQQLIAVPAIAADLFSVGVVKENVDAENVNSELIREMQRTAALLLFTTRDAFDPVGIQEAFRFDDNDAVVRDQHDAFEFFYALIDKCDSLLAKLGKPPVFKRHLGGVSGYEYFCKGCQHRYAGSDEEFNALNLELHGCTLEECLEHYMDGALLEGDSAYHCDKCGDKRTTLRIGCFRRCPRTLVIQLKRFALDYSGVLPKVNAKCEFPMLLDVSKYTKDARRISDASLGTLFDQYEDIDGEIPFDAESIDGGGLYELVGVIVHVGQLATGHYTTYYKERREELRDEPWYGKWVFVNDTSVEEFQPTPEAIDRLWYGGVATGAIQAQENNSNAYMLIYERVDKSEKEEEEGGKGPEKEVALPNGDVHHEVLNNGATKEQRERVENEETEKMQTNGDAVRESTEEVEVAKMERRSVQEEEEEIISLDIAWGRNGLVSGPLARLFTQIPEPLRVSVLHSNLAFFAERDLHTLDYASVVYRLAKLARDEVQELVADKNDDELEDIMGKVAMMLLTYCARSLWWVRPVRVFLGARPSEETNLIGDCGHLLHSLLSISYNAVHAFLDYFAPDGCPTQDIRHFGTAQLSVVCAPFWQCAKTACMRLSAYKKGAQQCKLNGDLRKRQRAAIIMECVECIREEPSRLSANSPLLSFLAGLQTEGLPIVSSSLLDCGVLRMLNDVMFVRLPPQLSAALADQGTEVSATLTGDSWFVPAPRDARMQESRAAWHLLVALQLKAIKENNEEHLKDCVIMLADGRRSLLVEAILHLFNGPHTPHSAARLRELSELLAERLKCRRVDGHSVYFDLCQLVLRCINLETLQLSTAAIDLVGSVMRLLPAGQAEQLFHTFMVGGEQMAALDRSIEPGLLPCVRELAANHSVASAYKLLHTAMEHLRIPDQQYVNPWTEYHQDVQMIERLYDEAVQDGQVCSGAINGENNGSQRERGRRRQRGREQDSMEREYDEGGEGTRGRASSPAAGTPPRPKRNRKQDVTCRLFRKQVEMYVNEEMGGIQSDVSEEGDGIVCPSSSPLRPLTREQQYDFRKVMAGGECSPEEEEEEEEEDVIEDYQWDMVQKVPRDDASSCGSNEPNVGEEMEDIDEEELEEEEEEEEVEIEDGDDSEEFAIIRTRPEPIEECRLVGVPMENDNSSNPDEEDEELGGGEPVELPVRRPHSRPLVVRPLLAGLIDIRVHLYLSDL